MDTLKLRRQLVLHEGETRHPYVDTVGKVTIGIGHNLTDKGISTGVEEELYHEDVADALSIVATFDPTWNTLDDVRQRVLVDLAFNLGGKLLGFTDLRLQVKLRRWDRAAAALQNSRWYTQVGQRGPRLVQMLLTGNDPPELA